MIRGFLLLMLFHIAASARILAVFPYPAKSHHNVFQPILERLAEIGHHVTYVTPIPIDKPHANIQHIPLKLDLSKMRSGSGVNLLEMDKQSAPVISYMMCRIGLSTTDLLLSTDEFQKLVHSNDKYDIVLFESFAFQDSVSALAHKFNALAVEITPLGDLAFANELSGLPDNPSYMIDFKSIFTDDMTFYERLHNAYITVSTTLVGYYCQKQFQEQIDRIFNYTGYETRPPIGKLMSDKALILLHSHHSTSYSYPRAPHVKEIGGVHIRPNKPLPKDIQSFMDGAKDGVIYFSLGSIINMTEVSNENLLNALVKVFGGLKQKVLWKWGSDNFPKISPNIKMSKWFPQQDILAHKNMKIFITHGGYMSVSESVYHGVPLIGIPFFSDQSKNLNQVKAKGYGIKLERDNLTEISTEWAIKEILNNPRYKEEVMRRSVLFKDRPLQPVDEAVYWIQYVLKHGKALQPKSARLSFCSLHMLDIIGSIVIGTYIILKLMKCIMSSLCKKMCKPKNQKNKKD